MASPAQDAAAAAAATPDAEPAEDFDVTPYTVTGVVDYNKLIDRFGTQRIDQALLDRIVRLRSPAVGIRCVLCALVRAAFPHAFGQY